MSRIRGLDESEPKSVRHAESYAWVLVTQVYDPELVW